MPEERTRSVVPRAVDLSAPLRLIVFCGGKIASHPIPRSGELVLGRGEDAQVRIDHATVSRRHATLRVLDEISIVDHGSSNGTTIGGRKIAPNVPASLGIATIVELGDAMIVVQVDAEGVPVSSRGPSTPAARPPDGTSPAMQRLYAVIDNIAQSSISVIVRGETGSGKEVIAEKIHERSARAERPLVKLNCAALPEQLIEGELFGYERGAFTGATAAKPGLIEAADGGTLFLDEIGELPLATQAKLLRVVESREVLRLGSLKARRVDLRLLAATHRDLEDMVARGDFRQDLYYRLNGVSFVIPPLRERVAEIPRLASEFVARFCRESKRPVVPISAAALADLESYAWPGNVRELRNVMERAVAFCKSVTIAPEHLALHEHASRGVLQVAAPPAQQRASSVPAGDAPNARPRPPSSMPPAAYASPSSMPPAAYASPSSMPPAAYASPSSMSPTAYASPSSPTERPPPPGASTMAFGSSLPAAMDALERERILAVLGQCGGNQTRAAEVLGISRRTLLRRLDEYAVPRPRK